MLVSEMWFLHSGGNHNCPFTVNAAKSRAFCKKKKKWDGWNLNWKSALREEWWEEKIVRVAGPKDSSEKHTSLFLLLLSMETHELVEHTLTHM